MSIAQLLQPELNKFANVIHTNVHTAFGLHRNFPHGEILFEEVTYGMVVQSAMQYPDQSCLVYIRDPEDDHGFYFIDTEAEDDAAGSC